MAEIRKDLSNAIKTQIIHLFADAPYKFELKEGIVSPEAVRTAIRMITDTYQARIQDNQYENVSEVDFVELGLDAFNLYLEYYNAFK